MSYSVESTRRRLPLLYLLLPASALVIWILPYHHLVLDVGPLWLLPLWLLLSHLLCGLSYMVTSLSFTRGLMLLLGSAHVYASLASATHLQAALLVALAEETMFRYALLTWLSRALGSPCAGLLLSSALFCALHLRSSFSTRRFLLHLDLLLLALVLGGLTLAVRSLYPALIIHGLRNYILRCLLISREEYEAGSPG